MKTNIVKASVNSKDKIVGSSVSKLHDND